MIHGIYTAREDGDFDFIAAFNSDCEQSAEWVGQIREFLDNEGEEVLVREFGAAHHLTDVLEERHV